MNDLIEKIILDEEIIKKRIKELAVELSERFKDKNPLFICILKGAVVFLSDLIRALSIPVEIEFMAVSSYGDGTVSSGCLVVKKDLEADIQNRDIVIVEDIVDSGYSLQFLLEHLGKRNPKSITTCAFLDKPDAHKCEVSIDYIGFKIGNDFVVGYGLDYAGKFRNLPYLGILKKEVYQ